MKKFVYFFMALISACVIASCTAPENENSSSSSSAESYSSILENSSSSSAEETFGVLPGPAPAGIRYYEGHTMYDFTETTTDGKTFTLSKVLEEKKLVVLNFWNTSCAPCIAEFPLLNEAYALYEEDVAMLALSTYDSLNTVKTFKMKNAILFDMGSDSGNLFKMFGGQAVPTTAMINRDGEILFLEVGRFATTKEITDLFDEYLSDYE